MEAITNISQTQKSGSTLKKIKDTNALKLKDVRKASVLREVTQSFGKLMRLIGIAKPVDVKVNFAQASDRGKRDYQQDETFVGQSKSGAVIGVLADGMGGHVSGDVASALVKESILDCLMPALDTKLEPEQIHQALSDCVEKATKKIAKHIKKKPKDAGMGTTLIITVVQDQKLFWLSIGDSPLYLWRAKKCFQINEDHSMGPALDQMAVNGMMTKAEALAHPDRNVLTSALNGSKPDLIDAGNDPVALMAGDIVVLSSDGLQIIPDKKINKVLSLTREEEPVYIATSLLNSAMNLDDPDQDNLAVVVAKVEVDSGFEINQSDDASIQSGDEQANDGMEELFKQSA